MNLFEAIKSGKPFRRRGDDTLFAVKDGMLVFHDQHLEGVEPFILTCVSAILADDWEVQEPTVTITRQQFLEAWDSAFVDEPYHFPGTRSVLMHKLGLE